MFKVQNFWKILEGLGLSNLGKSVLHGDDTSWHFMLISTRIFQSTVLLPLLCTDMVRNLLRDCQSTQGIQRTWRTTQTMLEH